MGRDSVASPCDDRTTSDADARRRQSLTSAARAAVTSHGLLGYDDVTRTCSFRRLNTLDPASKAAFVMYAYCFGRLLRFLRVFYNVIHYFINVLIYFNNVLNAF